MEERLQKVFKHFPHNICLVYYLVDSIIDGNDGKGCFSIGDIDIAFCKEVDEQIFWRENIKDYRFLFSAAILKYFSKQSTLMQDKYESFISKYFGRIANESKLFFSSNKPLNKKCLNITDFLYSEPDFALTRQLETDTKNLFVEGLNGIISIRKIHLKEHSDLATGETEEYGKDYIYVSTIDGNSIEELKYDQIPKGKLSSHSIMYASKLTIQLDSFSDIGDVISFALTDTGFVYIVTDGKKNYIRSQGFCQTSRLIRFNKTPIIVKAYENRVAVLMSDGTLTSNFGEEKNKIKKMWFTEGGELKTISI